MVMKHSKGKHPHKRVKPEIAFLNESPRRKAEMVKAERQQALESRTAYINTLAGIYGYRCLCCGAAYRLTLDHVRPISLGGKTELSNLQLLCETCNKGKGNRIIDYRGTLP